VLVSDFLAGVGGSHVELHPGSGCDPRSAKGWVLMTREEFIGIAADAVLRYGAQDPGSCPAEVTVEAIQMAEVALEAVGAWELFTAAHRFERDRAEIQAAMGRNRE
jgi:hypothetical protein